MKSLLRAFALILLAAPLSAQMIQVIPAVSTAVPEGLVISTSSARPAKAGPSKPASYEEGKVPLSGIVLMPTAYRGRGRNSIGLGLDFNAAYYIGRLYGKNTYSWTTEKKNYLDRVGVWLLSADSKMQV